MSDIGLQLTKYDLTKTCTINTFLFILTDNNNHRRLTVMTKHFDNNIQSSSNHRPTLTWQTCYDNLQHLLKSVQAKLLDTQEHFPDLHALVGLVQPHLIKLSSSPGARRVPVGIIMGVMYEVEPVTCV